MNRAGNDQGYQWAKENYGREFKLLVEKQWENIDNARDMEEHVKNE